MSAPDFSQILCRDRHFLTKAFKQPERFGGADKIRAKYALSHKAFLQRQAALPLPHYDNTLPVHEKRAEIKAAIAAHQVVIVCGETGSGKTTQLPKICLELGRGATGLIGHTQPRRLAARSVAVRIAEELGSEIGQAVGFKVRFTDRTVPQSYIKLMTDGILLAETQTDRFLSAYDTLIIDEAHERSLNIDFLLGYMRQLLPRRPDLKVIITSATIDAEKFSAHFGGAPVIEVSGRTYPVEIRYRPLSSRDEDEAEIELADAVVDAADELARLGAGDILVFLPGEREIREVAEALRKSPLRRNDEILPLFARLSHDDQQKIFHPSGRVRRIVLSTNVAETSLTVPGIRYVIDSGLARVKRYSARSKVEQLHVEKIAQAAARQRAGRCGRVAAGVCIRLYDEADFEERPAFTDPEILRSNLAAVILRMAALRLGAISEFPFLDAPDARYINDGLQVLLELGAVDEHHRLTRLGTHMARLPIDPKIARILLSAVQHGCMREMLVIVSALSIQDPRERPFDAREAAAKAHERFADKSSDFLSFLNIWASFEKEKAEKKSNKQLVEWCHHYFLSHLRMREWRELHHQLKQIVTEMGLWQDVETAAPKPDGKPSEAADWGDQDLSARLKQKQLDKKRRRTEHRQHQAADYESIHRALLTGLIANVGLKSPDAHDYVGARGTHFHLFPASALFKAKPKWVMAAELTDTGKLYARDVAKIEPEWIEAEAPHLVRYHYFDPHWEQKRGEVVASERVTLYGLTVLPRRPVTYGPVDPAAAREIFIRGALVAQEADIQAAFFAHNRRLIQEIAELEHKSRKQDVLVDDEVLFDFYHQRLPESYTPPSPSSSKERAPDTLPAPSERGYPAGTGGGTQASGLLPSPSGGSCPEGISGRTQVPPSPSGRRCPAGTDEGKRVPPSKPTPQGKTPKPLADIRTFNAWYQSAEAAEPKLLFLSRDDLMQHAAHHVTEAQFPTHWQHSDGKFALSYRFEPHHPLDGVTLTVPLPVLNRLNPALLEWLVPGMIREKLQLLIKALPKQIRRLTVPVPDFITAFLSQHPDTAAPILPQLAQAIAKKAGDMKILDEIDMDAWGAVKLPEHCYVNIRVTDDGGQELACDRNLHTLRQALGQAAAITFRDNSHEFEREELTGWDIGTLPEHIKFARGKQQLNGFLGIQQEKDGKIALRLFDTQAAAHAAHRQGVIALMALSLKEHIKDLNKGLPDFTRIALIFKHIGAEALREDITAAVLDRALIGEDHLPRDEKAFKEQIKRARSRLSAVKEALNQHLLATADAYAALTAKLDRHPLGTQLGAQLKQLVYPGFVRQTPWTQWPRLPVYVQAMQKRMEKYSGNSARDAARAAEIKALWQMWAEKTDSLKTQNLPVSGSLNDFRWMIEELRVSLFAQELKTPYPVSVKRLMKEWEKVVK